MSQLNKRLLTYTYLLTSSISSQWPLSAYLNSVKTSVVETLVLITSHCKNIVVKTFTVETWNWHEILNSEITVSYNLTPVSAINLNNASFTKFSSFLHVACKFVTSSLIGANNRASDKRNLLFRPDKSEISVTVS